MTAEKVRPKAELDEEFKFWTEEETEAVIKKHRRTLLRWAEAGNFPKPYWLGDRTRVWSKLEIQEWIADQKAKRSA